MLTRIAILASLLFACSSETPAVTYTPPPSENDALTVDRAEPVRGVLDRARDPAVVGVVRDGVAWMCSGTLVTGNIVLTTRQCVSYVADLVGCPADRPHVLAQIEPSRLAIYTGEDAEHMEPRARGRAIVAPSGDAICDADVAFVVLDRPIVGIDPLPVRESGAAQGDRVRTVGYGQLEPGMTAKLVREHVAITQAGPGELVVSEASCKGEMGGPALDESNGKVVGVLSRRGPSCDGKDAANVYTRTDGFIGLLLEARALAASSPPQPGDAGKDASTKKASEPKAKKPPSDVGSACARGADCAAGACVTQPPRQYCSRPCAARDKCPSNYACVKGAGGEEFCVQK
jgi:hypothetical protein